MRIWGRARTLTAALPQPHRLCHRSHQQTCMIAKSQLRTFIHECISISMHWVVNVCLFVDTCSARRCLESHLCTAVGLPPARPLMLTRNGYCQRIQWTRECHHCATYCTCLCVSKCLCNRVLCGLPHRHAPIIANLSCGFSSAPANMCACTVAAQHSRHTHSRAIPYGIYLLLCRYVPFDRR